MPTPDSFIGNGKAAAETHGFAWQRFGNPVTLSTERALGRERSGFATARQEAEVADLGFLAMHIGQLIVGDIAALDAPTAL